MRHAAVAVAFLLLPSCISPESAERGEHADDEPARGAPHPFALAQRAQARRLADGTIPRDALVQAWQRRTAEATPSFAIPVQWSWLGPANVGGRVRAILIHPTNHARIWIGSAGGGVWRSDDAGTTWQPMNGLLTMLGCGCMALDPANPDHLLFGSGEGFFDADAGSSNTAILRGAGVFESFDAGGTWARVPSTATPDWEFVNRLAYSPQNAQVLLAATGSGIWRSGDGGATWSRRTTERALDVDFHPASGTEAMAGRSDGVALRSTDGGATWTASTGIANATRIEVAYARSNPAIVFATASDANDLIHVWRSTDSGQTFTQRSTSGIATYSLYNNLLWVDPLDANNLLYGGVQLYRSYDGGVTRAQTTTGAHADYHTVLEHPAYGPALRRVYVANDGGIYTRPAWDTGTWTSLNQGLGITQLYGVAVQPATGVIVAGAQDNGTSRYSGSAANWQRNVIGGDGGFCAADAADANYFYAGFQRLGLQRSSNGGVNWVDIRGATTTDVGFNFIPWFALDPNNGNRMYACGRALWRTDDVKTGAPPTWTQVKPGRTCAAFAGPPNAHFRDNAPCNHATVAIAAGDSNLVWTAHNDGELYRTTNATAPAPTWTLIDGAGGTLPDRWINCIAIDPTRHAHVIVSLMGYATDNLWETNDAGASWQPIAGTGPGAMPALPVSWIAMHPRIPTLLFAATDLGVFASTTGGAAWAPVSGGPENVCIEQLVWKNERELLVVTHGRGVYGLALPVASAQVVGTGCGTPTVPVLTSTPPILGATATLSMTTGRANAPVWLVYSPGPPLSQPVGACVIAIDLPNATTLIAGSTDAAGSWSYAAALPPLAVLVGAQVVLQAIAFGNGGALLGLGDVGNGLDWRLGL